MVIESIPQHVNGSEHLYWQNSSITTDIISLVVWFLQRDVEFHVHGAFCSVGIPPSTPRISLKQNSQSTHLPGKYINESVKDFAILLFSFHLYPSPVSFPPILSACMFI